jgi:hypothetical protein
MNFEDFLNTFKRIEGIKILESKDGPYFVSYVVVLDDTQKSLSKIIDELKGNFACDISMHDLDDHSFKIILGSINLESNLELFYSKIVHLVEKQENDRKKKYNELGIPDLSLVTIKQMVEELKKRKNLVFSLVWIENNERDNIAIEGSGNPTQLVGLLARGVHMAIEWADKSIRFNK